MTGTPTLRVDASNAEQARAWDGEEGSFWAEHAQRFDEALARYHGPFLDAAQISDAARVLDIGCGTGQTTRDAARRAPQGTALGVDLSSRMIGLARLLAEREGVGNASFVQADAQIHPFPAGSIDVAISRSGAMFFGDPAAAFANIARAVRPDGRLALLTWQAADRSEWLGAFVGALAAGRDLPPPPPDRPGPFALSDPDRVRALLGAAGFVDVVVEGRAEPMSFGRDPEDAHRFVLGMLRWMLGDLDDTGRSRAVDALRATLEAHHTPDGVLYGSAAWIVTARRARVDTARRAP